MATARELVLRYGWNSTAYQILNPGIEHWFAPDGQSVIGFVRRPSAWVAAGAPVCDEAALPEVAAGFEEAAAKENCQVCYICAGERLAGLLRHSPSHTLMTIGAEPVWNPADWQATVRQRSSLRAQLNRAVNKGVTVASWTPETTGRVSIDALRACLAEWLSTRPMPPMGFLVEPAVLDGPLADRQIFVAQKAGRVVGFLVASPIPVRRGYLIEEIARGTSAPNGTAELLIDAAMRQFALEDCTYATMGLVALSTHAAINRNPLWVRPLMAWARAHGRRFYNFEGLERFRTKMNPRGWETIYAISNEAHFSPGMLWSVAGAFTHGRPVRAILSAMGKGIATEARWLVNTARRTCQGRGGARIC